MLVKGIVFDWGDAETSPLPENHIQLHAPFRKDKGYARVVHVSPTVAGPSDVAADTRRSWMVLHENGVPLGPRHAIYEEIIERGRGRYAHFGNMVCFSSSDGSDPNTNGRLYSFCLVQPTPKVMGVGGCHMNMMVRDLHNRHLINVTGLGIGVSFSPLESLRLIHQQLGLREEPEGIGHFAIPTEHFSKEEWQYRGQRVELLMAEVTANTNVLIGDVVINRCRIINDVMARIDTLGEEAHGLVMQWNRQGLLQCDEEVRAESAAGLLNVIHGTALDTPVMREIIRDSRGVRQTNEEMVADLAEIRELTGAERMVIISGPNFFTPDGRGLSWGKGLLKGLVDIAAALDIPLVEIAKEVQAVGIEHSVLPDMIHHTDNFINHLGDAVLSAVESHFGPWVWPQGVPKPLSPRFVR